MAFNCPEFTKDVRIKDEDDKGKDKGRDKEKPR